MSEPIDRLADTQLAKVREYLIRIAKTVTRAHGFQWLRRDREDDSIEYQIFADTKGNDGTQIAWVQSTRHDAEFIAACLAQAPLFADLLAAPRIRLRCVVTDDLRGKLLREVPPGLDGAIQVLDMLLSGDWGGVGFCQIDRDAFAFVRAEALKAKETIEALRRTVCHRAPRRAP